MMVAVLVGVLVLVVAVSGLAFWLNARHPMPTLERPPPIEVPVPTPKVMTIEEARRRNIKQVDP